MNKLLRSIPLEDWVNPFWFSIIVAIIASGVVLILFVIFNKIGMLEKFKKQKITKEEAKKSVIRFIVFYILASLVLYFLPLI